MFKEKLKRKMDLMIGTESETSSSNKNATKVSKGVMKAESMVGSEWGKQLE